MITYIWQFSQLSVLLCMFTYPPASAGGFLWLVRDVPNLIDCAFLKHSIVAMGVSP